MYGLSIDWAPVLIWTGPKSRREKSFEIKFQLLPEIKGLSDDFNEIITQTILLTQVH